MTFVVLQIFFTFNINEINAVWLVYAWSNLCILKSVLFNNV